MSDKSTRMSARCGAVHKNVRDSREGCPQVKLKHVRGPEYIRKERLIGTHPTSLLSTSMQVAAAYSTSSLASLWSYFPTCQ